MLHAVPYWYCTEHSHYDRMLQPAKCPASATVRLILLAAVLCCHHLHINAFSSCPVLRRTVSCLCLFSQAAAQSHVAAVLWILYAFVSQCVPARSCIGSLQELHWCYGRLTDCLHIAGECIDAVSGELTFFTLPNCFELFGFDLMVDDQWRVWLLEVSAKCLACP